MDVTLGVLLAVTAVVTVAYWLDFFLRGSVQVVEEEWYLRFERAFPVADGWMAACCLVTAVGLFTTSSYAVAFGLMAAGALVFLGLMDLTFNLQNRLFRLLPRSAPMWAEVTIVAWCLVLGTVLAVYFAGRVA